VRSAARRLRDLVGQRSGELVDDVADLVVALGLPAGEELVELA
jgi:hypothetical protein